jgi:hypothetical protein
LLAGAFPNNWLLPRQQRFLSEEAAFPPTASEAAVEAETVLRSWHLNQPPLVGVCESFRGSEAAAIWRQERRRIEARQDGFLSYEKYACFHMNDVVNHNMTLLIAQLFRDRANRFDLILKVLRSISFLPSQKCLQPHS